MIRVRALGYGALVAVVVFYSLAVPTLRDLFGPGVVLPAYAAIGVLAGVATYHAVRYVSRSDVTDGPARSDAGRRRSSEGQGSLGRDDLGRTDAGNGDAGRGGVGQDDIGRGDDASVEEMLGELETDREE